MLAATALLLGACAGSRPSVESAAREAPGFPKSAFLAAPLPGAAAERPRQGEGLALQRASLAQADAAIGEPDYDEDALFGVGAAEDDGDPLETLNRFTFAFNDMLDTLFLRPVAFTYRELVPLGLRNAVRSFLRNLATPVILINDLLQGDGERALITSKRFFVNTAFSLGFYDYASEHGLRYHEADFGQTLGTYGAGEGFYLVLPVFGPSSLRDATGRVVDTFLDPLSYVAKGNEARRLSLGRSTAEGVDGRASNLDSIDEVRADALDDYVRIRSLWRQLRDAHIQKIDEPDDSPFGSGPIRQF